MHKVYCQTFAVPPPFSQSFHLPFVEQSAQVLAHLLFAAQLFYRINTHALKNAFQLQITKIIPSSFDWLGFCSP
jgi:hypothetical protein